MLQKYDVTIVGGGAAGMMAAGTAAKQGKRVLLVEKNKILGKKILITGKGRCNITNGTDIDGLINNVATNARFLYSAFNTFTNYDTISFFNALGVETKEERGRRIFPVSDKSSDVVNALVKFMKENNVEILNDKVTDIIIDNGKAIGIKTLNYKIYSESVIVATGGVSYKATGSTGDGYKFAKKAGHTIKELKPSLVPLVCKEKFVTDLMGLSLKNVKVSLMKESKEIYSDFGEMIFTHFGVSGPVILSASCHINDFNSLYRLVIDLKPALTFEQLDKRIQRDFSENINKDFQNSLNKLLPQKLIPVVVELSKIGSLTKVHQITKKQREDLCKLLKTFTVTITGKRPIDEAIITSGGVKVNEINPKTMESKITGNLYFCGEVLDVDAYTGGFNLQIAFSTGYLAGANA